jgi:hypothetical protein
MTAKIEGQKLIIEIDLIDPPTPSASGKTLLVASSGGNQKTSVLIGGKSLVVGLNAYIKKD